MSDAMQHVIAQRAVASFDMLTDQTRRGHIRQRLDDSWSEYTMCQPAQACQNGRCGNVVGGDAGRESSEQATSPPIRAPVLRAPVIRGPVIHRLAASSIATRTG